MTTDIADSPDPIAATSVFIDVRRSTEMTLERGVSDMRDLLQAVFLEVTRAVEIEGGQVRDLHGDGAFAIFQGDDRADRALAAAITIQEKIADHCQVRLRIGISDSPISSGVVIGHDGTRMRFWVGGNVADKISKAMPPSQQIGITQRAFDLLSADTQARHPWSDPTDVEFGTTRVPIRTYPHTTTTGDDSRQPRGERSCPPL
jgi:class 3 adenylate cyclase